MRSIIKILFAYTAILTTAISCSKDKTGTNGAANTATAASANLTMVNRVLASFVIDSSSLNLTSSAALPMSYNKFRKLLTYDTISTANKPTKYKVGDTLIILGYVKGDDYAVSKRGLNFRFFQTPTTFITPNALNPIQVAEESGRNFAPKASDILSQVNFAKIGVTVSDSLNVSALPAQLTNGVNYSTYLVKYRYIIPAALQGKLISINFTIDNTLRSDIGNVNWNLAFYVK